MNELTSLGILRFTKKEWALNTASGLIYFGPAEKYRTCEDLPGVYDPNEGRIFSYRKNRDGNKEGKKIEVNISSDNSLPSEGWFDITNLVNHFDVSNGSDDYWISCWYHLAIDLNDIENELNKINAKLNDMAREFGESMLFIRQEDIDKFVNILNGKIDSPIHHSKVMYTDEIIKINKFSKLTKFSYQNEYRFVIDGKPKNSDDNKIVDCSDNLDGIVKIIKKLIIKNGILYYLPDT